MIKNEICKVLLNFLKVFQFSFFFWHRNLWSVNSFENKYLWTSSVEILNRLCNLKNETFSEDFIFYFTFPNLVQSQNEKITKIPLPLCFWVCEIWSGEYLGDLENIIFFFSKNSYSNLLDGQLKIICDQNMIKN
jgi:hypothetical protein